MDKSLDCKRRAAGESPGSRGEGEGVKDYSATPDTPPGELKIRLPPWRRTEKKRGGGEKFRCPGQRKAVQQQVLEEKAGPKKRGLRLKKRVDPPVKGLRRDAGEVPVKKMDGDYDNLAGVGGGKNEWTMGGGEATTQRKKTFWGD